MSATASTAIRSQKPCANPGYCRYWEFPCLCLHYQQLAEHQNLAAVKEFCKQVMYGDATIREALLYIDMLLFNLDTLLIHLQKNVGARLLDKDSCSENSPFRVNQSRVTDDEPRWMFPLRHVGRIYDVNSYRSGNNS